MKRVSLRNVAFGLALFLIGVVKKVVLADAVSPIADHIFDGHAVLNAWEAWSGALAYTAQIYFDFSGYTDMALGLSRMFNITLPLNFNSPYKAQSIVDFWRRWHMTLSRFLRDYLYIALGGNRHGAARRYFNLFATMVLGGMWHGAGWTFLIWGALHGAYLIIDHGLTGLRKSLGIAWRWWMGPLGQAATFFAVVIGWVFFRATTFSAALRVLQGMSAWRAAPGDPVVREIPGGLLGALGGADWCWILGLLALALFAPNSQEIIGWAEAQALRLSGWRVKKLAPLAFSGFAATMIVFVISLTGIRHGVSPFIYFNF